jgi:dihydrofolate reductase
MKPEIILIAAMGRNNVIGIGNDIPWRGKLPADMAHFQRLTMGSTVVMGRKTWESIPAKYRPLPGRDNIVLTRDQKYDTKGGASVVTDALGTLTRMHSKQIFIIGGAEVYKQFLPVADKLELTIVDTLSAGDAYFPSFNESEWTIESAEVHEADEKNMLAYTFRTLVRK